MQHSLHIKNAFSTKINENDLKFSSHVSKISILFTCLSIWFIYIAYVKICKRIKFNFSQKMHNINDGIFSVITTHNNIDSLFVAA